MKQDIQTAMAQQQARCVEYETKVIQAQQQVKVLETQGDAAAQCPAALGGDRSGRLLIFPT